MEGTCTWLFNFERKIALLTMPQKQCAMGVYPFMFGSIKDFEPVVQDIIKVRRPRSFPSSPSKPFRRKT